MTPLLSGSLNLTQDGPGTLTLNQNNTYTGTTTINSGILSVSSDGNMGIGGAVVINDTGTLFANSGFSSTRVITLGGGSDTIDVVTGGSLTLAGQITGGGNLVKGANASTLILSSSINNYGGNTIINGGTLRNGVANALPTTTALTINNSSVYNMGGFNQTLSGLSGNGTVTNGGTLTIASGSEVFPSQHTALTVYAPVVAQSGVDFQFNLLTPRPRQRRQCRGRQRSAFPLRRQHPVDLRRRRHSYHQLHRHRPDAHGRLRARRLHRHPGRHLQRDPQSRRRPQGNAHLCRWSGHHQRLAT